MCCGLWLNVMYLIHGSVVCSRMFYLMMHSTHFIYSYVASTRHLAVNTRFCGLQLKVITQLLIHHMVVLHQQLIDYLVVDHNTKHQLHDYI